MSDGSPARPPSGHGRVRAASLLRSILVKSRFRGVVRRTGLTRLVEGRILAPLFDDPDAVAELDVDGVRLQMPGPVLRGYLHGRYEPLSTAWVKEQLSPGHTAVDVGAHIGYFTLLMANAVGGGGRVFAFEPEPRNLGYLRRNVASNAPAAAVTISDKAVGSRSGQRVFRISTSTETHGFYAPTRGQQAAMNEVVVVPLDEAVPSPVHLVKIDVEGGELEVLEGMRSTLERSPEAKLLVEWNPASQREAGVGPDELPRALSGLGFNIDVLDDPAMAMRSVDDVLAAIGRGELPPDWYGNLACQRPGS